MNDSFNLYLHRACCLTQTTKIFRNKRKYRYFKKGLRRSCKRYFNFLHLDIFLLIILRSPNLHAQKSLISWKKKNILVEPQLFHLIFLVVLKMIRNIIFPHALECLIEIQKTPYQAPHFRLPTNLIINIL